MILGFIGAGLLFVSWLVQGLESILKKKSVVSIKFWLLRLVGASLLLIHAIQIKDLVFVLLNFVGASIFAFNLFLYIKAKNRG